MEDGYLTVATRQWRTGNEYSMQNRLRLTQLVHAQHFIEVQTAPYKNDFTKD
jgi:hypothetical protein